MGALNPVRSTTVTTHYYEVEASHDSGWPDLFWPSWKPGTTKRMRPYLVKWTVTIHDGGKPYRNKVIVYGHRINASGLGATVDCDYYDFDKLPRFVQELVDLSE